MWGGGGDILKPHSTPSLSPHPLSLTPLNCFQMHLREMRDGVLELSGVNRTMQMPPEVSRSAFTCASEGLYPPPLHPSELPMSLPGAQRSAVEESLNPAALPSLKTPPAASLCSVSSPLSGTGGRSRGIPCCRGWRWQHDGGARWGPGAGRGGAHGASGDGA